MSGNSSRFSFALLPQAKRIWLVTGGVILAVLPAVAQLGGPTSTGVSASLIRLFGTNNFFTAQAEVQVLGKNNQERIGTPMNFTLAGNKIRVEVDMNKMRNKIDADALAKVKPLGLDHVISVIQPAERASVVTFPKLQAFVKLDLPPSEAEAFLKRAKIARTTVKNEKMEGHPCIKQQVVITDESGKKSEATVWVATDMRDFPVCVATREEEATVVIRFRKVQFGRVADQHFAPSAGYQECADMQVLMAGPVVSYMNAKRTALRTQSKPNSKTSTKKTAPVKKK